VGATPLLPKEKSAPAPHSMRVDQRRASERKIDVYAYFLQRKGLRGRKTSPDGYLPYRKFKYLFVKFSFSDANDAPPQLD
jgi:hypothetical protein